MSRGPGRIQRAILTEVQQHGEVQFNELCWAICLREGRVSIDHGPCGLRSGQLDRAFFQAFSRAARGLHDNNQIGWDERKLGTPAEMETYYPYRTHDLWVLDLRKRLLPIARKATEETEHGRYSRADNERHILGLLAGEDERAVQEGQKTEKLPAFIQRWRELEPQIFRLLGMYGSDRPDLERREALFHALVRGRELFVERSEISCSRALGESITQLRGFSPRRSEESSLYHALITLYDDCFPTEDVAHVDLKTRLYKVVDFSRNGGAKLTQSFKERLYKEEPAMIRGMPGFRPPPPMGRRGSLDWFLAHRGASRGPAFDPLLDKLIARDVLHSFVFLKRLPTKGAAAPTVASKKSEPQ